MARHHATKTIDELLAQARATLPDRPSGQWIAHMGALVVSGVDPPIDVKQRDATPICQPDGFRFTSWNTAQRPDVYPL